MQRTPNIAFLDNRWVDSSELKIGFDDVGFRQSVIAVERLRTYGGKIFRIRDHLQRWQRTCATLQIHGLPIADEFESLLMDLLLKNQDWVAQQGDVGVTMIATPGSDFSSETEDANPTVALHLNHLDLAQIGKQQRDGQALVVTDVVQPPPHSWPRNIKTRCRLHYYLADHHAKQIIPFARGVLLDQDNTITETSVCNLAIVRDGEIISPPPSRVLPGITQSVMMELAKSLAIDWSFEPLPVEKFRSAKEVLMMGTVGGLWFANAIDEQPLPTLADQSICRQLQSAFVELISRGGEEEGRT